MFRLLGITLAAVFGMLVLAQMTSLAVPQPAASAAPAVIAGPAQVPVAEPAYRGGETVIQRDASGQFQLEARVNGAEVPFLVDTGADVVALTVDSAREAGIPVDTGSFEPILKTASGEGRGARYRVDSLEIAGRPFRDVDVVVVEGLGTNLLGQSVLRRYGRVEISGDRLVLD